MRLSVSSLTCPDWDIDRMIREITAHGIGCVDLRTLEGRNDVWNLPDFSDEGRWRTKRRLEEAGVGVGGVSTSVRAGGAEAWVSELAATLALCRDLGGQYLRIFAGPKRKELLAGEEIAAIVSDYRAMCRAAEEYEIRILVETHDVVSSGVVVRDIVERVAHPLAGVVWDVRHPRHHAGETYRETAAAVAETLRLVHVKDFEDESFDLIPFGTGALDAPHFVDVLRSAGYDGDIVLEQPRVAQTNRPMPVQNIEGFARVFADLV